MPNDFYNIVYTNIILYTRPPRMAQHDENTDNKTRTSMTVIRVGRIIYVGIIHLCIHYSYYHIIIII